MVMTIKADVLFDGEAEGNVLALQAPICFWGGLDPKTGQITDPHHPNHQADVADKILTVPEIVGSSSSSQILLESMYQGKSTSRDHLGQGGCDYRDGGSCGSGNGLWHHPHPP